MDKDCRPFFGTLAEPQAFAALNGAVGAHEFMPGYQHYRCASGVPLNWWRQTDTVNFHGPPRAPAERLLALIDVLDLRADAVPALFICGRR